MTDWNIRFWEYEFYSGEWLWLLIIIPVVLFALFAREKKHFRGFKYSDTEIPMKMKKNWILRIRELLFLSFAFVAAMMIFALAKPFHWSMHEANEKDYKDGIDIVITMDVSGSMLAMDFKPNRLEAAKKVAIEFINGRKGDRIGLVAFAGEAFTACPPTLDYEILKKQIAGINGDIIGGGTAIGVGLGTAVTRLRNDSIPSKVVILLTDGVDTGGEISPLMAAELAKTKNVRVYTIGVGSKGEAQSLVQTPFGSYYQSSEVELDEVTLKKIAMRTGGKYFRAVDESSLRSIYQEIDQLEKRKMEHEQFKSEPPATPQAFLNWAFLIGLLSVVLLFVLYTRND
jgi:Ca-activated chloride channel family protein